MTKTVAISRNWYTLRLGVAALCWLLMLVAPARAEDERPAGLMWNRTGLPAVFPLQIKTTPGADYMVVLTDAETGDDALAAYARGGGFFRVLVPPGTYTVRVHYGSDWQGEEKLFGTGPETGLINLSDPLRFEIRGHATKSGHLIDLRDVIRAGEESVQVVPLDLCQGYEIVRADPQRLKEPPHRPKGPDDLFLTLTPTERRALGPSVLPYPRSTVDRPVSSAERQLAKMRARMRDEARTLPPPQQLPRYRIDTRTHPCN